MQFRYDDENRKFSRKELDRQNFIDNSIIELINKINPTAVQIKFNRRIVGKVRNTLIEIFTRDLDLCTERTLYP